MPAAYNPYDPAQQKLLGALSLSEVGGAKNALNLGTGGYDLSNAPRDEYGFPEWNGLGNSHAAGLFQFQPGTWESYAKTYDLDFQDAGDQKAGAWYLAQDTFKKETGGDLSAAIQSGDYASIEAALGKTQWIGARGKLAGFLSGGKSASLPDDTNPTSDDMSAALGAHQAAGGDLGKFFSGLGGKAGDAMSRLGLFAVGAILLLAAAWWLLSSAGVAPGPGQVAKLTKLKA